MKAYFPELNTIAVQAESSDERLLLMNFAKGNGNVKISSITKELDVNGYRSIQITRED